MRNPSVVLSPRAQLEPYKIEATNDNQKKSSSPFGSKAQVAISTNAKPITLATNVIRHRWGVLSRNLAFTNLVTPENMISDLKLIKREHLQLEQRHQIFPVEVLSKGSSASANHNISIVVKKANYEKTCEKRPLVLCHSFVLNIRPKFELTSVCGLPL